MKKITAICLTLVMLIGLCACGSSDAKYTVGVCQLTQHDALDSATEGFVDAINDGLGEENINLFVSNASGDIAACTTIVNDLVSRKSDLILANATPALQAAAAATSDVPILGTAVTHYAPALDIDDWTGVVGGNISGTSDLAPLDEQARMIAEWFPNAKKVAILFCSAEANSIFQAQEVAGYLKEMGLESEEYKFSDTNDIASVTLAACGYADVIYIPTDNTAAEYAESIANVVYAEKVPVITGEMNICAHCGVATISINYYDLGYATGKMAVRILKDGEDISTMKIEYADKFSKLYNPQACEIFGITPVEGYDPIER